MSELIVKPEPPDPLAEETHAFWRETGKTLIKESIGTIDETAKQLIGVVLQTPHLFSGTIRENVRYGRLDAKDDEVEQAARLAGAHDFIATLEKGYDSPVGEGGNLLSVGQKQLISLARQPPADWFAQGGMDVWSISPAEKPARQPESLRCPAPERETPGAAPTACWTRRAHIPTCWLPTN